MSPAAEMLIEDVLAGDVESNISMTLKGDFLSGSMPTCFMSDIML